MFGFGVINLGGALADPSLRDANPYPTQIYTPTFTAGLGINSDSRILTATDLDHYYVSNCRLIAKVKQANNFAANTLPVTFGGIDAVVKDGNLLVNRGSKKESNNSYFGIEASTDGTHFKSIGKANTKAQNGNSGVALSHQFKTTNASIMGMAAGVLGTIVLLLAAAGMARKRKIWIVGLGVVLSVTAISCTKQTNEVASGRTSKLWVRIVQVDKDGTKQYSKIIQAVVKDYR